MNRDLLPHLPVVLSVAKRGGFAAAARELGMSPSAVSHAVRLVEDRLGQPLFARTTRKVRLTDAGAGLVEALEPAFDDIAGGLERLRAGAGRVTGRLRLNAPGIAGPMGLTPVLAELVRRHPDLEVDLHLDEGLADIVGQGFDAGIRVGEMIAEDMVAVRLTPPFETVIVAAPDYLARFGRPESLTDLSRHDCIGYRMVTGGGTYAWELSEKGKDVTVDVRSPITVTDALAARDLAVQGAGLCYTYVPLVAVDIAEGRLVSVLKDAQIEETGLFIYFPRRASMSPKLRAFLDLTKEMRPRR